MREIFLEVDEALGSGAGAGDELHVGEFGDAQVELSMLHGTINRAWAAQFQIELGEPEAIT